MIHWPSFWRGVVAFSMASAVFVVALHSWDLRQARRTVVRRSKDALAVSHRRALRFLDRGPTAMIDAPRIGEN